MDGLAIIYPLMLMTFGAAIALGLWSRHELKKDMQVRNDEAAA